MTKERTSKVENKKPQSVPAPAKASTQPVSAKTAQPTQKKPNTEVTTESSARPSPIKAQAPAAKASVPQTPAVKAQQPTQKKPDTEVTTESSARPSPIKSQAPAAKASASQTPAVKVQQPTPKKPNTEVTTESSARPSPIKAQAPAAKASAPQTPAAKASATPNTTIPTSEPKPKAEPLPKPTPELKEQIKVTEQQAANGDASVSTSTTISTFGKVATKKFVIRSWQLALAVAVVLALVTGAVYLGTVLGGDKAPDLDDSAIDYNWILSDGDSTTPVGIILPGYPSLTFPAGESRIELVLPNPLNNPCYFRYTLTVVETGEVLYQSKLIAPGQAVLAADLSRALPMGTYTLRITIDTFSLADGTTPMNGGVQEVTLNVK